MSISDILTLFGIFVAIVIGVRSLRASKIGIRLSRESLEVARLAYLAQVKEPVLKAFAAISGDWPTSTITVTNTGDDHFSVSGILIDVNGDGSINTTDINCVINGILGKSSEYNCDVNGDGVVNITDMSLVINAVLGKN